MCVGDVCVCVRVIAAHAMRLRYRRCVSERVVCMCERWVYVGVMCVCEKESDSSTCHATAVWEMCVCGSDVCMCERCGYVW